MSWNGTALDEALVYAQSQRTTGFLIIQNGRDVAARNWPLPAEAEAFRRDFTYGAAADGALLEDVASQQKSFVALLLGVAVDKRLIDIDQPVSAYAGAGWSKASSAEEARICVRHLMEMNSGLKDDLTAEAPPDTKFHYNTPAYAITKRVLEGAARRSLDDLTHDWLTAPTGMTDTSWRQRPAAFAGVGNPTGLVSTPRDIAIMGQLVLDRGRTASGAQLISEAQLTALLTPSATNGAYGRLWWLNGSPGEAIGGRSVRTLIPSAPADAVLAAGAMGRKLYISPSHRLLVVRTGQAPSDDDFDERLWAALTMAMPA